MADEPLRLLILGAHPDDAEFHAGGLAALYRQHGHVVKMVSVTDGGAGHHEMTAKQLIATRRAEAAEAAAVIGAESEVLHNHDGHLQVTLEVRHQIIREIRTFRPDLVVTHRTNDYHPDHRAVGQSVQDASFLVTVPKVLPDVPALRRDPVVAYMVDRFTKPYPLVGDVVLDIGPVYEAIIDMLACHRSQVFEWLPYLQGILDEVPEDPVARRRLLSQWYDERVRTRADRYRQELINTFGTGRGGAVEYAEVYEISEYAAPLDAAARKRLFGFLS